MGLIHIMCGDWRHKEINTHGLAVQNCYSRHDMAAFQCCSLAKMWHWHSKDVDFHWEHPYWNIYSRSCKPLCTHGVHASRQLRQRWTNESTCNTVNNPVKMEQSGMSTCALSLSLLLSSTLFMPSHVCLCMCVCELCFCVHAHICLCSYKCACEWENEASLANLLGERFSVKARECPLKERRERRKMELDRTFTDEIFMTLNLDRLLVSVRITAAARTFMNY